MKTTRNTDERFLVTGALGCIGAWTVKRLVDEGVPVWAYDLGTSLHRLQLIMDDEALNYVKFVQGDITDFDAFNRTLADNGITHIVHLAAFQVPFVRAQPVLGAKVNLVGMSVVLEAAKQHMDQLRGLVYASSVAVYSPDGKSMQPVNLYGVHKIATEGLARIYSQDFGLHSIGLRPHTVYGPGRDQGMTSTPTKAMLAAAVRRPYEISFGGTILMEHADDIAGVFIQAARTKLGLSSVYDVGGNTVTVEEIIAAINDAVPEMTGKITYNPTPLTVGLPPNQEAVEEVLGKLRWRSLAEGVRQTVEQFKHAARQKRLDVDRALA